MSRFAIIVVGYNRIDSISRLLTSLIKAKYDEKVDLIISIDKSETNIVEEFVENFKWPYGEKIIKLSKVNLGLKKHILNCGNYINEFDLEAAIVLEDDLIVSPGFFNYAKQSIDFYKEDESIAGISLYSHSWNHNIDRPFSPVIEDYDTYFLQYAQSWGQIWLKRQWNEFYKWYEAEGYKSIEKKNIPDNVLNWPSSSWLKYHIQYCITKNKYFVYPYTSLSTNFSDAGTHYRANTNKMQVNMELGTEKKYNFPISNERGVRYDSFFENKKLNEFLEVPDSDLSIDIYGMKKNKSRYVLTMKLLPFEIIRSFGLEMRPHELNVIHNIKGTQIFLYDTNIVNKKNKNIKYSSLNKWIYDTKGMKLLKHNFIDIIMYEISGKIKRQ